jgi:hypothetical protein
MILLNWKTNNQLSISMRVGLKRAIYDLEYHLILVPFYKKLPLF